jgi:hypothetical protein
MDWLTAPQFAHLVFAAWLFISIGYLPKLIANLTLMLCTSLLVGALLAWIVMFVSPNARPWDISVNILWVIAATFLALVHSEIIFRRKHGYWKLVGPRA